MISYKIHLLRTGSTGDNRQRQYVGQRDLPLSENGREALSKLREDFSYPYVEKVYSSPLLRCLQTAEILYPGHQPQTIDGLKDMDLGEFQGKTFEELKNLKSFENWLSDSLNNAPPGGEQVQAFTQRITSALDNIAKDMMRQKITDAAVITHGGVLMSLMAAIALPRLPIQKWAVNNGCGYTLLTSTQMWMQSGCAEAFAYLPGQLHDLED